MRSIPVLTIPLCLLLGLSTACEDKNKHGVKTSAKPTGPIPVKVQAVTKHEFKRRLELEGNLEPAERILIAPSIPGVIRKITKRAGDRIKKGELLVQVDPKEVYVGTIQLRVSIASARAKAAAADEILAKLKDPLTRLRRLYKAKAISKAELDKMELPYVKARAERDAANRVIKKVNNELGIAYSKLSDTKILAPFDGFVVRRLVDPGETARPFPPTVVLVVTKHHPLYVQAEVNEDDIIRLKRGQTVAVHLDALLEEPVLKGTVEEIIPYVNPMTRTVTIRVRVDNKDGKLMPGMSARVTMDLAPRHLVAVPEAALATEPLERTVSVFVVDSQGRARERRIRFGRSQNGFVSVLQGLKGGERVVVAGHDRLVDKSKVTIESADPAAAPRPRTTAQREGKRSGGAAQ